jgi:mono/diheme cytochrome c family protein
MSRQAGLFVQAAFAIPLLALNATAIRAEDASGKVTYAEQIAAILDMNCAECHRPGQAAPFSLLSYEEARKRGPMLATAVQDRTMPPWHPDPSALPLRDARILSEGDIELIDAWVEQGMPEGDPARRPAPPKFPDGWRLGTPDMVLTMDQAFEVPADGRDIFRSFVFKLNLPEDKWVKAVELRPSAQEVVHHALFFLGESEAVRKMDGQGGKPGFARMGFPIRGMLGGWALGATPRRLPDDLALPLPAGTDLVMQTHFHPSGKVQHEKSTIGLYLTDEPPSKTIHAIQTPPMFGRFALGTIKAGDSNHVVKASRTIADDIDLIGVGGHAHYIAKSMKAVGRFPDGTSKVLFSIPHWDFDWQGRYDFAQPERIPAGTRIDVEIVYDNSAGNPSNPSNPPVEVTFGEQSTDEMGAITFTYLAVNDRTSGRGRGDLLGMGRNGGSGPALGGRAAAGLREAMNRTLMEDPERFIELVFRRDADGDGSLSREEAPERLARAFDMVDLDGDGRITREELRKVAEAMRKSLGQDQPAENAKPAPRGPALNAIDGTSHHPLNPGTGRINVVVFVTDDCPIANAYAPTINRLRSSHAGDPVDFWVVHIDRSLSVEEARAHADDYGYDASSVLLDAKGQLAEALAPKVTPEAFVIREDGSVAYRGRIDDFYEAVGRRRSVRTTHELADAIDAVLAGKAVPIEQTEAVGCVIVR